MEPARKDQLLRAKGFPHQPDHFARLGMAVSFELRINQTIVHADLELAAVRRDQGDALYIGFEALEQFIRQAHGPVGVMSNSAIDDFDACHNELSSRM